MKKFFQKTATVLGILTAPFYPVLAEAEPSATKNTIQDTQKAAQYFEDELNFKTSGYFINRVITDKMPNITIVDVRAEDDFAKGHIPGAINIPFGKYNSFDGTETEFPGLRKDGFNCIYCYTATCNLSQKAAKKFASLGYPVKEIMGGYTSWVNDKYAVETGAK